MNTREEAQNDTLKHKVKAQVHQTRSSQKQQRLTTLNESE